MSRESYQVIEHQMAVLGRLLTAKPSDPVIASMDRSGYLILNQLDRDHPVAIHTLAHELMLDISTASRQVASLEGKLLVERICDPSDARASLLQLTRLGAEHLRRVREARTTLYQRILATWSAEDIQSLQQMLQRLTGDMKRWKAAQQ